MKTLTVPSIFFRQNGHSRTILAHFAQHTRCRQGKKRTSILASRQILHVTLFWRSSYSRLNVSKSAKLDDSSNCIEGSVELDVVCSCSSTSGWPVSVFRFDMSVIALCVWFCASSVLLSSSDEEPLSPCFWNSKSRTLSEVMSAPEAKKLDYD